MKTKNLKHVLLISLISIFLVIFNFILKKNFIIYAESVMAAFILVILFLVICFFGYQKDKKNYLKNNIFIKVCQVLTLYFIIIYLLGLYFGFSKIVFSLKPMSILNNIFAPIITFCGLEILRYILTKNNIDNKKMIILFNILIGFLELSITTRTLDFNGFEAIYKSFADFIIPISVKQVMLCYLCIYGGLRPTILYRLINVIYMYIVPIHPNFSDSIICMSNILLPLLVLINVNEIVDDFNKEKEFIVRKSNKLQYAVFLVIFGVVGLFVSGFLPVGIMAIASDSMAPMFSRGSVVVTLKLDGREVKKGDVVSFYKDNKTIVHRIDTVLEDGEEIRYYTKGDANNVVDSGYITYNDINNKVIFSIPLIGYPSIIISELFK